MGKSRKTKTAGSRNSTYKKNERAIAGAVFSLIGQHRGKLTAGMIAREAGVSRNTVYRHCKSIGTIVGEMEDRILDEFAAGLDNDLRRLGSAHTVNTRLFYALLTFMKRRRDEFCPICADANNHGLLYQMVLLIYPRLEITWLPKGVSAPAIDSERAEMLMQIIVWALTKWGVNTHRDIHEMDRFVRRLCKFVKYAEENRLP